MSKGCGPQRPDGHPAIIDSDWNFIQKCLQFKPELRPSADEVLDFVTHRSPVAHGGPGDMTEQYLNIQSSHPNHELKTLITVMDQLFASTSSTPAHSILPFSHIISSNELSESSTGPGPSGCALKDMFQCTCCVPVISLPTYEKFTEFMAQPVLTSSANGMVVVGCSGKMPS
ncbi:hypothetical protein DEU56DRAFT_754291 [Suillus clintonianus]|uniref:uncharacterized protein n=1 Tax=Suillus clintonianus TaxID=1904413 RepID=UPI001B88185A|nr:uncharacterized protein DEU56DRAFT_754291 [Suillus clintonianus]KAG2144222.1 hypothetical protein DEU56DRAFT_754291 [Suillus clintonianus]